ncbi:hypothetical protein AKJ63_00190 [candidate division MSBL1 archaeon SCGC-AAA259D18]|uniref:Uncharacterized protein n=1 Tax=candidate division MSBL1 archaeon SCGC-AAA259D18 TaxID=1698262 RepID=A0A133UCR4_9EURY|nr:hypothetical protein AKJ63_00190 [candidate division MSBL1 archaeon SCGC-AAA259D18]
MHIYREPSVTNLNFDELASYPEEKIPFVEITTRGPPEANQELETGRLAEKFARTKVKSVESPEKNSNPLYGEIKYEEGLIENPSKDVSGVMYDGHLLSRIYHRLLPEEETDASHLHIIFTKRLFGTWGEKGGRYHARVSLYSYPTLISTSGIVEAPAKPKEFYREKRQLASLGDTGGTIERLKEKFEGRFIDYDDERLTEVMKGYVMQALFYHLRSDPFCEKECCRLYNAHWQEEVIRAQLDPPEFCEKHRKILEEL